MKLEHIAIWTDHPEQLRDYYVKHLGGKPNEKYVNPTTGFESYFLTFHSGARLEIMSKAGLSENTDSDFNRKGYIHMAFEMNSKAEVDAKAIEMAEGGFPILKGPRITGDGYYEFETVDVDGNKIEITAKNI